MEPLNPEIYQLGAIATICVFLIREVFAYLKSKKNGNGVSTELALINQKLDNHIHHFCEDLKGVKNDVEEIKHSQTNLKIDLVKLCEKIKINKLIK